VKRVQEYAISYASLGFHILALQSRSKRPHTMLAKEGLYSATNDFNKILKWFLKYPTINIGIACQPSGVVVFDVDQRAGGTLDGLPPTRTIKTGDGYHLYYQADPSMLFPGKLRDGVDIKWRGYVVAAPSIHPSGVPYQVIDDRPMVDIRSWYK
jgi:hypothetical protein